jgi:hypothetical protein
MGMPDGVTICRDHRRRIAVRNVESNRLSYVPERELRKAALSLPVRQEETRLDPPLLHETAALNPWRPEQRPIALASLGKFGEELNECGAAVSRCVIQGIDESEPVTGKLNREWLEDEIADVLAGAGVVTSHFGLNQRRIVERQRRKRAHLAAWHRLIAPDAAGLPEAREAGAPPPVPTVSDGERQLREQLTKLTEERDTLRTALKKAHDMVSRAGQPESHDFIACLFDGIYGLQEGLGQVVAERDALRAAAKKVIENRECNDPDCCDVAIAHEAAIQELSATLATGEDQ